MPTDWENCYRTGDTPWDKGAPAPPLLEWLSQPNHQLNGDVLVPGCGFGYDVRALAANQDTQVCGLDFVASALAHARQFPPTGSETYVVAGPIRVADGTPGTFRLGVRAHLFLRH